MIYNEILSLVIPVLFNIKFFDNLKLRKNEKESLLLYNIQIYILK